MKAHRLLHDHLLQWGARGSTRDRVALIADGKPYTFGRLLDAALRLAGVLHARGVQRGDRVAIYLENSWTAAFAIYGTLLAGGVFVLINPQTRAEKLEFILRDCSAQAVVTEQPLEPIFLDAIGRLEQPPAVLCAGQRAASRQAEPLESALATASAPAAPAPTIPLDLAAILYTSGSTATPKGVMQTHQSMLFTTGSLIEYLRLTADERILCVLPLSFDYGLYQLLMTVALGACLVLERSFAFPGQVMSRMRDEEASVFPGVPTIFATLLATHRRAPLSFPSVGRVTNTAAALPEEFVAGLREIFPNALIYKMYGLTECKRVSYLEPELIDAKPGSVGKPIPGTEAYVLSADGQPVSPGATGILYVRGPHVMAGYWNRPDLTAQMLKPGKLPGERVLCTHDLFRIDEEGFLYFVGRTDDIIKTRGEKVSPVEVENALHRIPGVREAAVVGVPDPHLGEAVRAYVVVDPSNHLTVHSIRAGSAKFLESYMVPTEVILCESLPRSPNGKVNRRDLLEQSHGTSAADVHESVAP
ncbi:MAG: class I adenylate-forming enzyme family protein [Pseudomonadota bacterium]|jgi:amino acid adenylation domain-containing protein|nr:class I adenylate-forming enzyme family protein [Pseudomonadota bacterium]